MQRRPEQDAKLLCRQPAFDNPTGATIRHLWHIGQFTGPKVDYSNLYSLVFGLLLSRCLTRYSQKHLASLIGRANDKQTPRKLAGKRGASRSTSTKGRSSEKAKMPTEQTAEGETGKTGKLPEEAVGDIEEEDPAAVKDVAEDEA